MAINHKRSIDKFQSISVGSTTLRIYRSHHIYIY